MIKKIMCMLIVISILAAPLTMAEETEGDSDGLFKFRGIDWYATKSEALEIFKSQGLEEDLYSHPDGQNDRYIEGIQCIDSSDHTWKSSRIYEGGGYTAVFRPSEVAGYGGASMSVSFIYPVKDGSIVPSDDDAQLYLAYYKWDRYSKLDISLSEAFSDLYKKLKLLYGDSDLEYIEQITHHLKAQWSDREGNTVILFADEHSTTNEIYEITLGYVANNAQERFEEVLSIIEAEENAILLKEMNTDGL